MTCRLVSLTVDALDPEGLARFWAGLLGWQPDRAAGDGATLLPADDTGFSLRFLPTAEPKTAKNGKHLDLTSGSWDDQERTVARALELGGRHVDIGQLPEEQHVVLADPEGNEFCVIEPGNGFLADCGFVGALACDGSQAVGYFWRDALGWPLVWDQDLETAVRSPHGGPKVTWDGVPLRPDAAARDRLHLEVAADGDLEAEVARLVSLGATRAGAGPGGAGTVVLADPDGNEFLVLPPADRRAQAPT
ncbi:VOC family protein [Blastococcus sp. TF02A-35]|uniref:VOC family protein n=1 Tax=Blastococcus sp. TF02A-35 TaxID=2559612 RepID=UPI0010733EBA|nr:VOC family protein [Blastococcus sp. TF02A_35]TFV53031.1 VOC family protein [Blastococcus sp. TF02A_35]